MTTIREVLDTLPKVREAKIGDKHEGQHMACRLCTPDSKAGDTVTALCGAEYVLDGISTTTEVARENKACADCLDATQEHVYEAHPDIIFGSRDA